MAPEGHDPEALLERARTDTEAFAELYLLFERRVLVFFMRATGRPELAADLTAETFARALEHVERYERERGLAEQWLFGIARNLLRSSYRTGRVEADARARLGLPRLLLDDEAEETIARLAAEQAGATVALARLPEHQRDAIDAHVLNGRSYAEMAGELHCSEALARQRVSRGLRALRARLEGSR